MKFAVLVLDDDFGGLDGLVPNGGDVLRVDSTFGDGLRDVRLNAGDLESDRCSLLVGRLWFVGAQDKRRPSGDDREDKTDSERVDDVYFPKDAALSID